jgi:hypothetical protein
MRTTSQSLSTATMESAADAGKLMPVARMNVMTEVKTTRLTEMVKAAG